MKPALIAALVLLVASPAWASDAEAWYQLAAALEQQGKSADAIKLYVKAARAGNAKAEARLRQIVQEIRPGPKQLEGGWGCPPECGLKPRRD